MYTITKEFVVEYAHRLKDHKGACRNIHGHSGRVIVTLGSETLNAEGMILDFSELKEAANETIGKYDHALVLEFGDPFGIAVDKFNEASRSDFNIVTVLGAPTAENFSQWIYTGLRAKGLPVVEVTFYETAKNCASYKESK